MSPGPRRFDPEEPELMDRPQPVSGELERDLENLRSLNRHFGSYRIIRWFFRDRLRAAREGRDRLRILDLATGFGDIPRLIAAEGRRAGREVEIEAVDFQASTLEIARQHSRDYPEIRYTAGNILEFEPRERVDFVTCSLALHHLAEADAVEVLRRAGAWGRRGVLVSDLRRSVTTSLGIYLITATVYREEMTRRDARTSAERAFSCAELVDMTRRAGWEGFDHRRFGLAWQAVWKAGPGS